MTFYFLPWDLVKPLKESLHCQQFFFNYGLAKLWIMVFSDDNPVLREGLRQIVTVYISIYFLYCFVILGPVSCLQQSRQESSLFWYTSNLHTNGSYREGTRRILITLLKPILSISWSHRVVVLSTHSGYFYSFLFWGWSSTHLETWFFSMRENEAFKVQPHLW